MILSFELTMPNVGSWNGKWSGASRRYYQHRTVTGKKAATLTEPQSFYYNFGDGWGASVAMRPCTASEKRHQTKVSAGFAGYDWMINEILQYGRILTLKERITKSEPVTELTTQ